MPGQKSAESATINGRLASVTLTVSSGGKRLAIRSLFPEVIPTCAPAALQDASMLLLLVLHDLQEVKPIPINHKAFSFCDGVLTYRLQDHAPKEALLGELKTLALSFQSIDWEGSCDEAMRLVRR